MEGDRARVDRDDAAASDSVSALDGMAGLVIIKPTRGWRSLGLNEVWEYRELLLFMAWRELHGTYRQTALGMSWILLRPAVTVLILSVTFGMVVKVDSDGFRSTARNLSWPRGHGHWVPPTGSGVFQPQ